MNSLNIRLHDMVYAITPVYRELHHKIKRLINTHGTGLSILEAPTTTGNLAGLLQQGQDVTTIDISKASLNAALKKNKNIKTRQFDAYRKLPFHDGVFDGVTSTHLLYFLKDKNNIVSEYSRVLKPGGILIVTEFDGYKSLSATLDTVTNKRGILAWKLGDIVFNFFNRVTKDQYVSYDELVSLLESHHFTLQGRYRTFGRLSNTLVVQKKD